MILPLHLGDLHAYEQWLVALIAFGPFVVLGIVVYVVRGREPADETAADDTATDETATDETATDETATDGSGPDEG